MKVLVSYEPRIEIFAREQFPNCGARMDLEDTHE